MKQRIILEQLKEFPIHQPSLKITNDQISIFDTIGNQKITDYNILEKINSDIQNIKYEYRIEKNVRIEQTELRNDRQSVERIQEKAKRMSLLKVYNQIVEKCRNKILKRPFEQMLKKELHSQNESWEYNRQI